MNFRFCFGCNEDGNYCIRRCRGRIRGTFTVIAVGFRAGVTALKERRRIDPYRTGIDLWCHVLKLFTLIGHSHRDSVLDNHVNDIIIVTILVSKTGNGEIARPSSYLAARMDGDSALSIRAWPLPTRAHHRPFV